jgi:hypothetical protein
MLDDSQQRLVDAWVEAFEVEKPELDRVRVRTRVLAGFEAARPRPSLSRFAYFGVAAAAVAATALVVAKMSWSTAPTFTVAGQRGEIGEWLATNQREELPLDFSEGTHVAIAEGSRARVEEVNRRGARVVIERGSLSAHVVHRAETAWHFEAGPFDVLVVGTSLSVNWDPGRGTFELGVQRGSVMVSGPLLKGHQEVRAGERCRVDLAKQASSLEQVANTPAPEPSPTPAAAALAPSVETTESSTPGAAPHPAPGSPWLALARDGKYTESIAAAERFGLARIYASASADDLLELARSARLAGRADVEQAALLACRQRFKGQPSAAKAAYLLGRAAGPQDAAQWFETYLREQPGGVLSREAAGRLIESQQRAGNAAAARAAATRYLASYPDGPHSALARSLLFASRDGG